MVVVATGVGTVEERAAALEEAMAVATVVAKVEETGVVMEGVMGEGGWRRECRRLQGC